MGIKIKIHPNQFEANGQFKKTSPFYGIDPKYAIISISTGKIAEGWTKILSSGRAAAEGFVQDGTSSMKIGRTGLDLSNVAFHYLINDFQSFTTFGIQIISLVENGHIQVEEDGTPLTVNQIRAFSEPTA